MRNYITIMAVFFQCSMYGGIVQADVTDNSICSGYQGEAFGICSAAVHQACGTDEEDTNSCIVLEEVFYNLTGLLPPWLPTCPCWTPELISAIPYPYSSSQLDIWLVHGCNSDTDPIGWAVGITETEEFWHFSVSPADGLNQCRYIHIEGATFEQTRIRGISDQEYQLCRNEVISSGLDRGAFGYCNL